MIDDAALAKTRKGTSAIKVKARRSIYHKFGYRLTAVTGVTTLPRSFSQSSTSSPSLSRFASQVDKGTHSQELHSLNTKTLQYIQQRFGLVASLLQLLCQVESSESKPPPSTAEDEETKPTKGPSLFKALKGQTPTKESKGKRSPEKRGKKWGDSYTQLLECYSHYPPLKAYIESRVAPFEDVLHFYVSENKSRTGEHRARHPLISDVGLAFAHTEVLRSATTYGLQKLTRNRKFQKALEMLSSEPLANSTEDSFLVSLKQTILRMVYLYLLKKEETFNPLSLLARLDDPGLCARLALQSLTHWPITICIDVLSMCSGRLHMNTTLLNVVNRELKKMKNYHEVCVCVRVCVCVCTYVCTYVCVCRHVYMFVCLFVCLFVCVRVRACVCVCARACVCERHVCVCVYILSDC